MSNEYEILEEQIGGLGAQVQETPENPDETPTPGLGKAKHFGVKHDTSEHETGSMIRTGWIQLDREEFEDRALFYPEDWKFFVKPASVEDIKNFSSIDENRPDYAQDILNEMLRNNFKITNENGTIPTLKLNSWDRLFVLNKIREYTFVKGENTIAFDSPCDACGENVHFELNSNSLVFEVPDRDLIDTYFDPQNRVWTVDPAEFGIRGPVLKFYVPTIEKEKVVLDWTLNEARESAKKTPDGKPKVNETLIKFLPWLLAKVTRDPKINDRFIRDAQAAYTSWGIDMFSLASEILEKIAVIQEDKLRALCPHCGEEVYATIQFRNGVRDLFSVSGGRKKFGEK